MPNPWAGRRSAMRMKAVLEQNSWLDLCLDGEIEICQSGCWMMVTFIISIIISIMR